MASSSSSSKRMRIRVYNPKPLSHAPPNTNPYENSVPFISNDMFDQRNPIPPGDPKRPPELPCDWIMEEHVRKGGQYIGRKYMIFIEPVNGEQFKSLEGVRRHLGLQTKRSKQQGANSSPKSTKSDPRRKARSTKSDPRQYPPGYLGNQLAINEMITEDNAEHEAMRNEEFKKDMQRAISESQMMYTNALNSCRKVIVLDILLILKNIVAILH